MALRSTDTVLLNSSAGTGVAPLSKVNKTARRASAEHGGDRLGERPTCRRDGGGVMRRIAVLTSGGDAAVRLLARGEHGVLVGLLRGGVATTPLRDVVSNRKTLDPDLLEAARILAK